MEPQTILNRGSYGVYIAIIATYLVLIWFFFPETRYVLSRIPFPCAMLIYFGRSMTIEEVSVLFDTGRKGDAEAAARSFEHSKGIQERTSSTPDLGDAEKQAQAKVVSHVE